MMTLLNSNFEEWLLKFPDKPLDEFKYSINKMGKSGALFDILKLNDVSKTTLATFTESEAFDFFKSWADEFGTDAQKGYFNDRAYTEKVLALCMGVGGKKRRKDFVCAKQAVESIAYFYDETFAPEYAFRFDTATVEKILSDFKTAYDPADDNQAWFDKLKAVANANGFATDMKAYKADPTAFPGSVSDIAEMLRIATTGLSNTPDLWTIMQILGSERTLARLEKAIAVL
jgi:glutamyl-tRNA synthetase